MLPRLLLIVLAMVVVGGAAYAVRLAVAWQTPKPLAVALQEKTDPRAVQALLRPAVRADPRNGALHVALARTQLELGDPLAAEKELKLAQGLRHDRAVVAPLLAQAYLDQGRYQDVLIEFSALESGRAELLANLLARTAAFTALGDMDRARSSIAAAVRVAPADPAVLVQQARVALAADDVAGARRWSDTVAEAAPSMLEGQYLRADVMIRQGELDGARAALDRAVLLVPFSQGALHRRAELAILRGDLVAAQRDVDAGLALEGRDRFLQLDRAVVMLLRGRVADAELELQRMAGEFERMPRGYYYQAMAAAGLNHNGAALDAISRYLKVRPKDVAGLVLAADLELRFGRPGRAIETLSQGGTLKDGRLSDALGRSQFVAGQVDEAIGSFRDAVRLAPGNREFAAHLAAAQALGSRPVP